MLKINFQSYKKLLRLTEILSHDIDSNYTISFRLYCKQIIISSAPAQETSIVRQELFPKKQITSLKEDAKPNNKPKFIINQKLKKNKRKSLPGQGFRNVFQLQKTQDDSNEASSIQDSEIKKKKISENYVNRKNYSDDMYKISDYHFKLLNNDFNSAQKVNDIPNRNSLQDDITNGIVLQNTYDPSENCVLENECLDTEKAEDIAVSNFSTVSAETNESTLLSNEENESLASYGDSKHPIYSRYKMLASPEGMIKYDLSADEFNVNKFVQEFNSMQKPLDECNEDLSDYGPDFYPTFNFAAYADKSPLIQKFIELNVKLYKVEQNQDHMRALLSVDMEKELPMYIQFLHDCGISPDCLGDVITGNPMIFKEDMDDLKTRIRYLRAHDFAKESVTIIITKNPKWLSWATKYIDERLGHFQNEFKLQGAEVRFLATKQPKLITHNFKKIHENTFAVREQMGFNNQETKVILLSKPRLWMNARQKIMDSFDYIHNTMKLSHLAIASQAEILTCRKNRLKNRHEFLMELKKVQYDPLKPGYIAPKALVSGSDAEFCRDVAKTALETYNLFLKTR